jgi:hypothetical protein
MSKIVKDEQGNTYNMIQGEYIRQAPASIWWFSLPIVFAFLGGIVMYIALRNRDRHSANFGMVIGIVMSVMWWLILSVIGLYYGSTSGVGYV